MSRRPLIEAAVLASGLALYVALAVASLRQDAATFDEGAHLPAGYTYWARGDFRLNPEHPPLVKLLAAAPLLLLDVTLRDEDPTWHRRRQWEFGRRFLYHWNDADRLLLYGRLPIVALGVLLCAAVYVFARQHQGPGAAAVALLLCVLSPDVLAHGRLVTTDVAITLFTFAAVAALRRLGDGFTIGRAAAFVAACAFAFATKFSALLFVPIVALLALLEVRGRPARAVLRGGGGVALAVALASAAALWASYGFRYDASPDPGQAFDWVRVQPQNRAVAATMLAARDGKLLPEALLYGFLRFFKAQESRPAFLHGAVSDEGWWYYFPVAFAVKTPLPLLVLLVLAAFRSWRACGDWRREAFLWLPPLVYMLLVMTRSLNIGHRHVLPIYPYLFVLAAGAAVDLWARRAIAARAAAAVLLAWYAAGTLRVHPHYLAYFNEAAGGPENGYRWLVDSNLDWGQGLKGLAAWTKERGLQEITLSYFGTADPDYYGLHARRLPGLLRPPRVVRGVRAGDVVAVSATNLQGVYLNGGVRGLMERLRGERPIGVVAHSIFVYRPSFDYEWADDGDSDTSEGPLY